MLSSILFYLYLLIGSVVAYFEWDINLRSECEIYRRKGGKVNSSALIMYMLILVIIWPLKIISNVLNK